MGVDRWIDQQLHPEKITDTAVEARLAPFRTLRMSSKEIVEEFPDNQMIRQVMDGKKPMPSDPARRAVYQVQIARLEEKQRGEAGRRSRTQRPTPADPSLPRTPRTPEELAAAAAATASQVRPEGNSCRTQRRQRDERAERPAKR